MLPGTDRVTRKQRRSAELAWWHRWAGIAIGARPPVRFGNFEWYPGQRPHWEPVSKAIPADHCRHGIGACYCQLCHPELKTEAPERTEVAWRSKRALDRSDGRRGEPGFLEPWPAHLETDWR
jgi:hypothetical protein